MLLRYCRIPSVASRRDAFRVRYLFRRALGTIYSSLRSQPFITATINMCWSHYVYDASTKSDGATAAWDVELDISL